MDKFYKELKAHELQKAKNEEKKKKEEEIKKQLENTSRMFGKKLAELFMKGENIVDVKEIAKDIYDQISEGIEEKFAEGAEKKGQKDLQDKMKEE